MRGLIRACAWIVAGLLGGAAFAQGVPASPPSTLALNNFAQELYLRGREHFFANDFERAADEFRRSLLAVDSPNTRLYYGRALSRLNHLPEAWAMLDRAARDADARALREPRYAATAQAAHDEANGLVSQIARLVVEVAPLPDDATVTLNEHPLEREALGVEVPLHPGDVAVMVRARGYAPAMQLVSLEAGASQRCSLRLVAEAPREVATPRGDAPAEGTPSAPSVTLRPQALDPQPRRQGASWRGAGVVAMLIGGVSMAGGVALYSLAHDEYDTLAARPMPSPDDNARADRGSLYQTLGFSLIGAGAALALSGSVMRWVLGREASEGGPARRPAMTLEPTARGVAVTGSF